MKATTRRLTLVMVGFVLALFLMLNWTMVVRAGYWNSQPNNLRTTLEVFNRDRGQLLVGDESIAQSDEVSGRYKYQRVYPDAEYYSHMQGWFSLIYGTGGLENTENDFLAGTDPRVAFSSLESILEGGNRSGGNVKTTINAAAQQAAIKGLGSNRGAVAAIDPRTGAILALASSPGYDPNLISSQDSEESRRAWEDYQEDDQKPMLYRTIRETYNPGSTFKVVTTSAALANGYSLDSQIPAQERYQIPGSDAFISNASSDGNCRGAVNGLITIEQALIVSCNTAFAELAVTLGESALREAAEAYGIDDEGYTIPLAVVASTVGDIPGDAELAQSGIGLRDVRLTALQNALVAAAVANDGVQMRPYLIDEYLDQEDAVVDRTRPVTWRRSTSPSIAADLTQAMVGVVQGGTGTNGAVPGVTVAGKTGTGPVPDNASNAWFISFAPADDPQIAVGVVVENVGSGGSNAAPISSRVMQAYFNSVQGGEG